MYNLKYNTQFSDIHNNRYQVEILDDTYTGAPKILELGPDAVSLSRPSRKITEPLFSMGVNIQVWCNENFQYADLFSTREQTNQVVLKRNGKIIFTGWIEPNLYEEDFTAPPYLITIPASDGLAALEDYYPEGIEGTGLRSLLSVMRACLACTGLNLPINIACSLNPDDKTDNRLFEQACIEVESLRSFDEGAYEYDNAKDLLEDILKPFSCRIYQSGGEWYVERIKDRTDPAVSWIRYVEGSAGMLVQRSGAIVLDTPEYMFVNNAASLQVDAGYGLQTVKADAGTWDTVIANNFADGIRKMPLVVLPGFYPFEAEKRIWYKQGAHLTTTLYHDEEIKQGLRMSHDFDTDTDDRIWQCAPISATNEDEIEISFKLMLAFGQSNARDGKYKVQIQSYLRDKEGNSIHDLSLKWNKDSAEDTFYTNGIGADYIAYAIYKRNNELKDAASYPLDVTFTAKLEHLHKTFYFDMISFAILPVQAQYGKNKYKADYRYVNATIVGDIRVTVREKRKYDNTFTATVNKNYMRKAEDIDIRFWTLPSKYALRPAVDYNFKNGLMYGGNTAIWHVCCPKEGTKKMSIPEQLLLDNFDQYYDPRDRLSGEVMTAGFIAPEKHISIATRPDKSYLLVGLEADLKESVYETKVEEIKPHQISING